VNNRKIEEEKNSNPSCEVLHLLRQALALGSMNF
jgi:hypothetical protein